MDKYILSDSSNLLEAAAPAYHVPPLDDVREPNLFRDQFSYDTVPKTTFDHSRVPYNMPKDIYITDTTFRDGQQSRAPYTAKQMIDLYKLLHKLGGPLGKIRQTEFFAYSKADRDAIEECMSFGYEFPEVTTWIRAVKQDFELVKDMGIRETGILVSCSDYHIFNKLGKTRKQAMDQYLSVVKDALDVGIRPRCHLEDVTRADFYGFVVPFVHELVKISEQAGIPIKIRACDTMGYGLPYAGVSLPRSVARLIYALQIHAGVPSELLEWHGHNDFYKAVANATVAWLHGAAAVNCSLLGIGERTGNVPLEAMVFEYASLRGGMDGMDPRVITEIAEYYERELGYVIPPMTPYVGDNFNVTRAGIHADGLLKDEEIYNIFDTGKLLNRPVAVAVSNVSGAAGITYWINTYFRLTGGDKLDKTDELVGKLKCWVDSEYETGRQTSISDEEMVAVIETLAPGKFRAGRAPVK
ncbi:MAG: 2-isopropylmalate synthase [Oscillospiraceae bacterium]|jgi:isopropylmalate/homocitrate/citramalate synthase|nr:2-isopropylmalate synthase [Oscillospiraceae bacterium]